MYCPRTTFKTQDPNDWKQLGGSTWARYHKTMRRMVSGDVLSTIQRGNTRLCRLCPASVWGQLKNRPSILLSGGTAKASSPMQQDFFCPTKRGCGNIRVFACHSSAEFFLWLIFCDEGSLSLWSSCNAILLRTRFPVFHNNCALSGFWTLWWHSMLNHSIIAKRLPGHMTFYLFYSFNDMYTFLGKSFAILLLKVHRSVATATGSTTTV